MAIPTISTAFDFNLRAVTLAGAFDTTTTPTFIISRSGAETPASLSTAPTRIATTTSAWKVPLSTTEMGGTSAVVVMHSASTLQLQQVQIFPSGPVTNTALTVYFAFANATTQALVTGGTCSSANWTLDGGTQVALSTVGTTPTEISGGIWKAPVTAAGCNGQYGTLELTHSTGVTTTVNIIFVPAALAAGSTPTAGSITSTTVAFSGGSAASGGSRCAMV